MGLVVEPSRTGAATCRARGIYLHSSYDPRREAAAYLDRSLGGASAGGSPTAFLLLGPGLDYLSPLIAERHPKQPIIRIQYSRDLEGREVLQGPPTWYPGGAEGLLSFLDGVLDGEGLAGLRVLDWAAGARAWPEAAEEARRTLKALLDRRASEAATLRTFGPRWLGNALRNVLLSEVLLEAHPGRGPVVVASAGPSLGADLEVLTRTRGGYVLIAVSSALAALRSGGLEPDLVVATDGGFWSRHHLYPAAARPCRLAATLSALPSACLAPATPLLPLVQPGFPETELGPLLGTGLSVQPHGTVSGTALHLAAALTDGPLVVAGLDLASQDILSHARPHGFDTITRDGQARSAPRESLAWARERPGAPLPLPGAAPWRTSRSLTLYAEALESEALSPPLADRLYRLRPSPMRLQGFKSLDDRGFEELLGREALVPPCLDEVAAPPLAARWEGLRTCLQGWRQAADAGVEAFLDGRLPGPRARDLFRTLNLVDYAAAYRAVAAGSPPDQVARRLGERVRDFLSDLEGRLDPWTT